MVKFGKHNRLKIYPSLEVAGSTPVISNFYSLNFFYILLKNKFMINIIIKVNNEYIKKCKLSIKKKKMQGSILLVKYLT